jgi:hypothetical protein
VAYFHFTKIHRGHHRNRIGFHLNLLHALSSNQPISLLMTVPSKFQRQPSHPYTISAFSALDLSRQQRYRQLVLTVKNLSPGFSANHR